MIGFIIRRPVLVGMLLTALCLLGIVSYEQLDVELIPQAELPLLVVQIGTGTDTDPMTVEREAVIPVEGAVGQLEDIDRIESYIDRQSAMIIVYYEQDANLKHAYIKLDQAVKGVRGTIDDRYFVNVWKVDTEQLSNQFMSLQARGIGDLDQIRTVVEEEVVPELESIDGIANVQVYGGRVRSVEVFLDELALKSNGLTPSMVSSRLQSEGGDKMFLGHAVEGDRRHFVNMVSSYEEVSAVKEAIIKDVGPIRLRHVAEVMQGGREPESISRINGKQSVSISLIRDAQANLLELSNAAQGAVEELNKELRNQGVELHIQDDQAEVIRENIDLIKELALVGGLLAIVILWIFLGNLRLVLIIAAAIPISALIAMNFFYAFDISLNTLTLVGLAIAIGMLLDNSIVVLENIYRQRSRGMHAFKAVVDGASEVWRPVLAATLTTVAVFLPFVYSDNFLIRILGKHVGVSIITTLLVSLAAAFLLIPAVAYRSMRKDIQRRRSSFNIVSQYSRPLQVYTLLLKSSLRYPVRTILFSVSLFLLSLLISLAVSLNVGQEVELRTFNLYAQFPSGTTLESADELVQTMDERIADIKELEERQVNVDEEQAVFTFYLKEDFEDIDGRNLPTVKEEVDDRLSETFRTIDFSFEEPLSDSRYRGGGRGGGGGGFGNSSFLRLMGIGGQEEKVVIRGDDYDLMENIAEDVEYNLDELSTIDRVNMSVSSARPQIELLFDKNSMSYFDVSPATVINELGSFQKEYSSGATVKVGDDEVDIVLKYADWEEKGSDDLQSMEIASSPGGTVPLMSLASMVYTMARSGITRINQQKEIEVNYRFEAEIADSKGLLESARQEVDQLVGSISVPAGVSMEAVHDEADYSDFYFLIAAAFILIYMILASAFESLVTPLAMMFTIPLATVGALWGLILTGNSILNANSLIGLIILLGVIVNNGIILIDYSRLLQRQNFRPVRALLTAGQARVRPIMITMLTTVIALLPLAMGRVEYVAAIGAPFAITVIGGLAAGTLFTLVFIPTVYSGLESTIAWWRSLKWHLKAIQMLAVAAGLCLIYSNVDSLLWRIVNTAALLGVVPAMTWFTMASLRRASFEAIGPDEPITITIQNVVKNYDDFSRFVKEWRKPERQRPRLAREGRATKERGLVDIVWHTPLLAFSIYFTYFYLQSDFWLWVFTQIVYVYAVWMVRMLLKSEVISTRVPRKLAVTVDMMIYWVLPLANLYYLYSRWESIGWTITVGVIWYSAVLIYATSKKLHTENIDVNRLRGKLSGIRKVLYRFTLKIPVIGKRRKPFRALDHVSMQIGNGMFGLIGPNGAGKTTLMRVICGVLEQTQGTIRINDFNLNQYREEMQGLIGYLPQEFGTYDNMTACEFLDYQAMLKGIWDRCERKDIVSRALKSVHLEDAADRKIKTYSGGMKQRVGIAQTLLHLPRILVVDEPTAGLDPKERIRFRNLLSDLSRDRIVVFSTHIIEDISSSCNRLAVMDQGTVRFLGTPSEMLELAEGRVWQVDIPEEEFDAMRDTVWIVHHSREEQSVRLRLLSSEQPLDQAQPVVPTLEDAYLWLLGRQKRGILDE